MKLNSSPKQSYPLKIEVSIPHTGKDLPERGRRVGYQEKRKVEEPLWKGTLLILSIVLPTSRQDTN